MFKLENLSTPSSPSHVPYGGQAPSIVDSDPVGSELLSGSESEKNHSGSEINLKQNYSTKREYKGKIYV
jgi:hypothetical protein